MGASIVHRTKNDGSRQIAPRLTPSPVWRGLSNVCFLKAVASGQVVTAICSIGDECVTFVYHAPSAALGDAQASLLSANSVATRHRHHARHVSLLSLLHRLAPHSLARGFTYPDGYTETERFADIVEQARLYILTDHQGSFERFAMWGLIAPPAL